jgi:cysteine desulfurase / selenocysteine lyase
MTTSEPGKGSPNLANPVPRGALPDQKLSVPAGLPEPELLARMANEFFTALPELAPVAQQSLSTSQTPLSSGTLLEASNPLIGLASGPASPVLPLSSATNPRDFPAGVGRTMPQPQIPAIPGAVLPVVASVAELGAPQRGGSFSFLEDIRPLFSYPSGAALPTIPSAPSISFPGENELRAFANEFSLTSTPEIPSASTAVAAPPLPAAMPLQPIPEIPFAFSFLNEVRSLFPAESEPTFSPARTSSNAIPGLSVSSGPFDVQAIRRDFPILQERVNGKPIIWLDNAATTQKPQSVIDRISHFYQHENSNIHRAAHELAARATDAYEAAREKTRRFLNARSVQEIIFARGATEGINLVAQSWGKQHIHKDDEIMLTLLEHHANIVPWQMLAAEKGARIRVVPVDNTGQVLLDEYHKLLNPRTKLVAFPQVSNALGTVTPVREIIEMAHRYGAKVLLDGAQAVSHMKVDVQAYDADFYVFSGHKVFAPTGIGVVFGKYELLEDSPPYQGGGNMIQDVTFEKTTYQPPPGRFEAGTGNIADAVGLGAAIDYVERVGLVNISRYEHELLVYATQGLQQIPGLRLIGTAREKAGVLSFVLDGFRTEDVGSALNRQGIAVRAGHHCAQPILRRFGVESTVRPSLAFYNTCEEIDALVAALWNLKQGHNPL